MNLATQLAALTIAVQKYDAEKQQALDAQRHQHEKLSAEGKGRVAGKKASARAQYQKAALQALRASQPLNSVSVGKAMGCGRLTSYKRLCVLEKDGLVLRVGSGVKTKWKLA